MQRINHNIKELFSFFFVKITKREHFADNTVKMEVPRFGTYFYHILIYDENTVRATHVHV
jgi:hypothetical protein